MSITCVGRENEIEKLKSILIKAFTGDFQICFLAGEAGSGKTTLLNAFAESIHNEYPDALIAIGECDARMGVSDPYLPFKEILAMLIGDTEAKLARGRISPKTSKNIKNTVATSIETILEIGPELIGSLIPGGAIIAKAVQILTEKSEVLKKLRTKVDNPNINEINQSTIFQEYTNVLSELTKKYPLMLVLDDLHWSDSASIALLFHLARKLSSSRIMIIGTYRPNEIHVTLPDGSRHPMESVINELKRYFGNIELEIDFSASEGIQSQAFINSIVDIEPNNLSREFRERLNSLTEGNALFATELLLNFKEKGDLVKDSDGRWIKTQDLNWDVIPTKVEGVIEERIARLENELKEALSIASVEGENFTAQVVSRLQELNERHVLHHLKDDLEKRHRLVNENGETRVGANFLSFFRFSHSLIHQYLYNELSQSEKRILHRQVAETLELLYKDHVETVFLQLARHYEEAGDIEKAASYLIKFAEIALRMSAFKEAKTSLDNADRLGVPDITLFINLHKHLGKVYYGLGEYELALIHFQKSRTSSISIGDTLNQIYNENELCMALNDLGRFAEAKDILTSTLQLVNNIGHLDAKIRTLSELGLISTSLGNFEKAQVLLRESLDLAKKNGRQEFIFTLYDLSCCLLITGEYQNCVEVSLQSIELCKKRGNREVEAYSWMAMGYAHRGMGYLEGAETAFKEGFAIGKDIDSRWSIAEALTGLGFIECDKGNFISSKEFLIEALRIFYDTKIYTGLTVTLVGISYLALRQGNIDNALELLGLATSHKASTTEAKYYAQLTIDLLKEEKYHPKKIEEQMKLGAEKDIDFVIQNLLK